MGDGIIRPVVTVVVVAPAAALAAAGELWDWTRPRATAAGLRELGWLREVGRDG